MRLAGKVSLITGAGSGIGRAAAELFAREGARVIVADLNREAGEATARRVAEAGGEAVFLPVDVAREASVRALMAEVDRRFGRLDVIFANAGIFAARDDLVTELEEEVFDRVLGVNLKGPLWTCKHGIPLMERSGEGGAIVITASLAALKAGDATAYYVSKAAVAHLARCIARQYANAGIRCNAICPGKTRSNLLAEVRAAGPKPPTARTSAVAPPVMDGFADRYADPSEIAALALFLASDGASFITGAVYPVDNGASAR